MKKPISLIIGWGPAVLVCLFMIFASALPKFLFGEGSELEPFMKELGVWEIRHIIGVLEIVSAVLFLIPRTATVGFVLMVGVLGGALATDLTHASQTATPVFPVILLALITLSAYFRCPELLARLKNRL